MGNDMRLIEDLIPVGVISEASSHEKVAGRQGHPSTLHRWWARRPLAAARAAVYAALVRTQDVPEEARSLSYFRALCRWGATQQAIADARRRVLEANGGEPPRVLDMFAGGGAIPLEAARLGCEATAVELNPVAHLIELCMLDYPQRFGPSLADDILKWGERWVESAWQRVGHLYPPVTDGVRDEQLDMNAGTGDGGAGRRAIGYLWTRTVRCPNPSAPEHVIPLVRQTWLARKSKRYIALKPTVDRERFSVSWEVAEAASAEGLGFDPAGFSSRGRATCFACGASVDANYVKDEGKAGRMGIASLAAVVSKESGRGRDYLAAGMYPEPSEEECRTVLNRLEVGPPDEPLPEKLTGGMCTLYGLTRFGDLFTPRQLAALCSLAQGVREVHEQMIEAELEADRADAVCTFLGLVLDRAIEYSSSLCAWHPTRELVANTYSRQALPMTWDFAEANPFGASYASVRRYYGDAADLIRQLADLSPARLVRTSAASLPDPDGVYDAVITDPPYYDNISYADLSDFFYVWLKRSVGFLFPEHLAGELTPKRREIIVAPYRHGGDKDEARSFYEHEMEKCFREAHRALKPGAPLVCVYAHKTTVGWASLVEALRRAGFTITEAWPLDTEMTTALKASTASLASSIFLVARRRESEDVGEYGAVLEGLDAIVSERLERLTEAGVSGSDLVIAAIGAGLRAFTQYARVERPNGEEVPAESFLEEVQSRVLNAVLAKVHGLADGVGAIDSATRYYVISRFSFGYAEVEFDEANNLARSAGVELGDLADGGVPLAKIKKDKVHLLDFDERGEDPELGIVPASDGAVPLIDVLHGLLWRANHRRDEIRTFIDEARFEPGKLRLVAQALQGRALRAEGEDKPPEAQACERLLGAWKTLVEDNLLTG